MKAGKVGPCTSPGKCKVLTTTAWSDRSDIQAAASDIEKIDDFCYLGSYTSLRVAVERTSEFVSGKQQQYLEKMKIIWKNKCVSLKMKTGCIRSNNLINPSVQCICMAYNSNTNEKTERRSS